MFDYEYDGERKLSNLSQTSKLRKSKADAIPSSAYNTLDGELMDLIDSSYEEAFDHDDINELERPLSFKKAYAQKRGNHSGIKVKVERKGSLGAKRRRNERQKEGGEDYQDDHQVKRGKKKKERRKGGVDYKDDHQVRRGKNKKEGRKGGVDYKEEIWKNKCSLPDLGTKKEEKQVDIQTKKKK